MPSTKTLWRLTKETFAEWNDDKSPRLAAALSYYSLFSLAPVLIIVIAVAGMVFGREAAQGQVVAQMEGLLGHEGAAAVQALIEKSWATGTSWVATIVGVVTLLIGATGVFAQLQDALNTIWGVTTKPGGSFLRTIRQRMFSFAVVLGIGFLLLVSLAISAMIAAFGSFLSRFMTTTLLLHAINLVVSMGVVTLLFALIYKMLPDVAVRWRDVWIGAGVTALLFTLGKFAIGIYLGKSSVASAFGAAGSVVIVLIWVYYSSLILFLGAEFTQVYARWRGQPLEPTQGAVPLTAEARARQGIPTTAQRDRVVARAERRERAPTRGGIRREHQSLVSAALAFVALLILARWTGKPVSRA